MEGGVDFPVLRKILKGELLPKMAGKIGNDLGALRAVRHAMAGPVINALVKSGVIATTRECG